MIENVVSWNGITLLPDFEADFIQGTEPALPPAQAAMLERIGAWPVIAALQRKPHKMALLIKILNQAHLDAHRSQLFRMFDPEDETAKKLIVENHDGIQMYRYALCEGLQLYSDPRHQDAFVATLAIDGDVRWRAENAATDTWNITASGQTRTLTNDGEDEAYPVFQITPTDAKAGGYSYKSWVPVKWLAHSPGANYPLIATFATDGLIGTGHMQDDGDDLRVFIDGIERYRWLYGINTAATKVEFVCDFQPTTDLTLKTAIAGAGAITAIELNEDITPLPTVGIVLIGTEAFHYGGKDVERYMLTDITRGVNGTTPAAHNIADAVYWIQHDVWIVYGNAAATAPTYVGTAGYADAEPVFELDHSTNASWVYEIFDSVPTGSWIRGQDPPHKRAARWEPIGAIGKGTYTATQRTYSINDYTVAGAFITALGGQAFGWQLYNPCGIVNLAWTNGLCRRATTNPGLDFLCHLRYMIRGQSWWTDQYTIPSPGLVNTWTAWACAAGAAWSAVDTIAMALYFFASDVEVGDVTVTLGAEAPVVAVYAEQATYTLAATITNNTTGEFITVAFEMAENETLEIDTVEKEVTYLLNDKSEFQAVTVPATRRAWLRLLPGTNVIQFDDIGTDTVDIVTTYEERYY